MNENAMAACRESLEGIWSSWPHAGSVPAQCLAHAHGCPDCRKELDAFHALCLRGTNAPSATLSWAEILPASRWTRLAAATQSALGAKPSVSSSPAWAPALALAAAGMVVLWTASPFRTHAPQAPVEAVEKLELLEHLDLLENWDAILAITATKEGAP